MSAGRLAKLMGDIFWSSLIVLGLLIVAFFVLRMVSQFGRGTPLPRVAQGLAAAATPQG